MSNVMRKVGTKERAAAGAGEPLRRPSKIPWPPRYEPSAALTDDIRQVERLDAQLAVQPMDAAAERRLWRESLARNAYATASIEGNPLSLADVESLLDRAPTPASIEEPDEREIINFAGIMSTIRTRDFPRTLADLNRLHAELFAGVLARPGRLKVVPNYVGSRTTGRIAFVPTPPTAVPFELARALDWYHGASDHPLAVIAVFFHEFQSIHPYPDGNGRLGRLLATMGLVKAGYPAASLAQIDYAINEDREAYYEALDAGRGPDWDRTPWIRYHIGVMRLGYQRSVRRALLLQSLPPGLKERQIRIMEWFARITQVEPRRAVKFNDVQAAFPTVPRRTLTYDLRLLADRSLIQRSGELKGTQYRLPARDAPSGPRRSL